MITDTITAIATGLSNAGLSIIRISGSDAFGIIDKIYRSKLGKTILSTQPSHTIHYGYIYDGEQLIDEVMVTIMKAPKTYTVEDVVEINCHGGIIVTKKVLEVVVKNGARIAEPGEFTKRAFLNGRIDLSQAEAVIDLIHAKNELAMSSSVKQLRGGIHNRINEIRDSILYDIAYIEAALDDPEHINIDEYVDELKTHVVSNLGRVKKLLDTYDNGRIIKEGIQTVILGKPNAGKSSLLNVLLKEERAIVTDIAGTTRDVLEESIQLNGLTLNVMDTAGIRETEDVVEKIGVEKAKKYANTADLILYVVDGSKPLDQNDFDIIKIIENKKAIVLLNKCDLDHKLCLNSIEEKVECKVIKISAKQKFGIDALEDAIKELFFNGELSFNDEIYITNLRQKESLLESYSSLNQVLNSIEAGMPEDFLTIDLTNAYTKLGEVIGEEIGEDVVSKIFKEFCMGK